MKGKFLELEIQMLIQIGKDDIEYIEYIDMSIFEGKGYVYKYMYI